MSNQKTVVVGLSGKLDSTVAAYLLKKQGLNVIGVGVYWCDPQSPEALLCGGQVIASLDELKVLADSLDITFYAANAEAQFHAEVVDPFVEARLFGVHFCIETALNKLLFEVLDQKAQMLKADQFATGHYAKVGRAHVGAECGILIPNDLKSDQSFALSKVPRGLLEKVIFPLADLRKVEVEKIGKLISAKFTPSFALKRELLFCQEGLAALVEKRAARKLYFKEGPIIKYSEDSSMGDHKGVYSYFNSQKKVQGSGSNTYIDREIEVIKIDAPRGVIYVDYPKNIPQSHFIVNDLNLEQGFDKTRGRDLWIQFCPYDGRYKGRIQFLNNGFATIELVKPLFGKVYRGFHLSLATKEGVGAKIIGSATVLKSGVYTGDEFLELPNLKDDDSKKPQERKWDYLF